MMVGVNYAQWKDPILQADLWWPPGAEMIIHDCVYEEFQALCSQGHLDVVCMTPCWIPKNIESKD